MSTSRRAVEFARPFSLSGIDDELPAGRYEVDTTDELIEGLSRLAYRRTSTSIRVKASRYGAPSYEVYQVNPDELDAALLKDKGMTITSSAQ